MHRSSLGHRSWLLVMALTGPAWGAAEAGVEVPCQLDSECASLGRTCIDGYCCDQASCGDFPCQSCRGRDLLWPNATNGTCTQTPALQDPRAGSPACPTHCDGLRITCPSYLCTDTISCATGYYCSPQQHCELRVATGTACPPCGADSASSTPGKSSTCNACAEGYCADGVCCNQACDGICEACTSALKGAGNDGTCGALATDIREDACKTDQPCGNTGLCAAQGVCATAAAGSTCIITRDSGMFSYRCNADRQCEQYDPSAICDPLAADCGAESCSDDGCSDAAPPNQPDAPPDDADATASGDVEGGALDASQGDDARSARCKDKTTVIDSAGERQCPLSFSCQDGACFQSCGTQSCLEPRICLLDGTTCGDPPSSAASPEAACHVARLGSAAGATDRATRWGLVGLVLLAWARLRARGVAGSLACPRSRS